MRRICIASLLVILLLISVGCKEKVTTDRFSFEPKNPEPGKTVEIYYNPAGTTLQDAGSIEMVYYVCIAGADEARSTKMKRSADIWTAAINLEDNVLAVAFKFVSGDKSDSNVDKGYTILLNDKDGNILPGAKGALADMLVNWRSDIGVIRTRVMKTAALQNISEEITAHPEFRKYFLGTYYYLLKDLKVEEGVKEIVADIKKNSTDQNLTAGELSAMLSYCGDPELNDIAPVLRKKLTEANPRDEFFLQEKLRTYSEITDPKQKEKFIAEISKEFDDKEYISYLQNLLLQEFVKNGNISEAANYVRAAGKDDPSIQNYFSSLILKDPKNYYVALDFSSAAVKQMETEIQNNSIPKPANKTSAEWKADLENQFGNMLATYGKALLLEGKKKEALDALQRATALTGHSNETANEYYVKALIENENYAKAMTESEKLILNGNSNAEIKNILKHSYTKENHGDAGLNEYLSNLEAGAKTNRIDVIKSGMLNITAPEFTLTDLQGKKISLKDYRGKSIVIDFWATWCPPCRASFPFLKKLVESKKEDSTVSFVFINTRDHEKQRNERVSKFLKDNDYPFYVLLDDEADKTNDEFVIPGLPSKVFIDKNGVIRYMMVGWEGEEEKELEKINTILELIK